MNGTLVIPKLMCIKFYRIFFKRTTSIMDKKKPAAFARGGLRKGKQG
ncbi:hypothetical protein AL497_25900 [Klebsiella aerogenes]|nr:hypothetical protein CRN78_10360 [Klebsiella aerogenes]ATY07277.1 hypothetical protein AM336_17740 [Klebsiella aerogenes]AUY89125.1 hypothetical protein AL497_25900 [Klebsiella aerogenes]AUZ16976.1 hypothetical protein AL511_26390 [Klebsiella aerogenes]AVF00872.1 hypothetical protein AM441_20530 [Klebsiella aerogenes]